ncbi:MAG: M90 family metallopeptidase [Phycisphaerae bacterium]|nr:M90 family metallopeptidase [Phycisphaerae bacterium]
MGILRRLRRKRVVRRDTSPEWRLGLSAVRHLRTLTPDRRERVESDAKIFAAETHWEGCGGLKVGDGMKAVVSALACLLVCDTRQTLYEDVSSVLLYPTGYVAPTARNANGVVTAGMSRLGEAHFNGPVVLSWADTLRHATQPMGRNLVLHEFAHRLDMLDGMVDGTPPMPTSIPLGRWVDTMTAEYSDLHKSLDEGIPTPLDAYAATNPGEFFAVSTEAYFERPFALRSLRPGLYDLLKDYYVVGG